jgi:hypothetical protein
MDANEQLGQPIVSNGLSLTKLHHAAQQRRVGKIKRRLFKKIQISGLPIPKYIGPPHCNHDK